MNSYWLKRIEMRVLLFDLQLEIQIENTTSFLEFQTLLEMSIKRISVIQAELMTTLSTFKGTVNVN